MARDVLAVTERLGFDRFALVGHDRGALVAFRARWTIRRGHTLASLDVLPTIDKREVMHGIAATVGFHRCLMAQPPALPGRIIAVSADDFFGHFVDLLGIDRDAIPAHIREHDVNACRRAVPSIVADYRASAGIDVEHDQKDRENGTTPAMPVTVLQLDLGAGHAGDRVDVVGHAGEAPALVGAAGVRPLDDLGAVGGGATGDVQVQAAAGGGDAAPDRDGGPRSADRVRGGVAAG
jgi:haloacetate dehalogenase